MNPPSAYYNAEEGLEFLAALRGCDTDGYLEIRAFRETDATEPPTGRKFFVEPGHEHAFVTDHVKRGDHVYIGIAVRASNKSGTLRDLLYLDYLWVEVDFKDYSGGQDAALAMAELRRRQRPPHMRVMSGGGFYDFYRIERVTLPTHNDRVKRVLQHLAKTSGADGQCVDASRVLRLPGTWNVKRKYGEPRPVTVEVHDTSRVYRLEEFEAEIPSPATTSRAYVAPVSGTHAANADYILNSALAQSSDSRHGAGLWLACQLRDNRYTADEAETVMRQYHLRVPVKDHEYQWSDAEKVLRDAYSRPAREPWGLSRPTMAHAVTYSRDEVNRWLR